MHYSNITTHTADYLANNGYHFDSMRYLQTGWDICKQNLSGFAGITAIVVIIQIICRNLDVRFFDDIQLFQAISNALTAFAALSYLYVAHKIRNGEKTQFSTFFEVFQDVKLMFSFWALNLLIAIVFVLGIIVFIIPGIYLLVGYTFASCFLLFGSLGIWESMEASRKVVAKNWFNVFGFCLLLFLVLIGGILCFGVGILVAAPVIYCAVYAAFEDIMLQANNNSRQNVPQNPFYDGF